MLRILKSFWLSPLMVLISCTPAATPLGGIQKHFEGYDIEVLIDGQPTVKTEAVPMVDSEGVAGRTVTWRAAVPSQNGKPCFEVRVKNPEYLGAPANSDLIIVEPRFDREQYRWRNFRTKPDPRYLPPYGGMLIEPGKPYCPTQYFLTERLTFPRLPAGDYYVAVRVGGKQSWDQQEILFTVEE